MPPVGTYERLTPDQVAKLKAWIDQGADYPPHWAFVPPTRPEVPKAGHPIDALVQARLEKAGLIEGELLGGNGGQTKRWKLKKTS